MACAAFAAAGVSAGEKPRRSINVMTFNIRYDEPRDGVNAWPNRKEKVAGVIKRNDADLVGVQEALLRQLKDLEAMLPDLAWVGVGRTDGRDEGEFSAIFYKKARFELLSSGTFWLSETPEKAGSLGWDAAYPRIVTWARFRDRQTRKTFVHLNTHFDHRGEKARLESAKLLAAKTAEIGGGKAFVVTGDFNARESTDVYRTLAGGAAPLLFDARYRSRTPHTGPLSTFNEFKELVPGMTIDHIFVGRKTRVIRHAAIDDRPGGLWPSDHLPVLAEIIF
jgi:endonuclease/exonuclease/phosphatase family metal-dependent hydrolase